MLLLDIEKAFDTVWHKGLIAKLFLLNIPLYSVKLILCYLNKRSFKVKINKSYSTTQYIVAGVPQGSILGPTLFLYFINDLPILDKTLTALFADDTGILGVSRNKRLAIEKIQNTLDNFLEFFEQWKIKVNASETELIIFSRRNKLKKSERGKDLTIEINNEIINPQNEAKYLGMFLDKKLNFNKHISTACKKAYQIKKMSACTYVRA